MHRRHRHSDFSVHSAELYRLIHKSLHTRGVARGPANQTGLRARPGCLPSRNSPRHQFANANKHTTRMGPTPLLSSAQPLRTPHTVHSQDNYKKRCLARIQRRCMKWPPIPQRGSPARWPRVIAHPRLPKIRTCALTHPAPRPKRSLRGVATVDHARAGGAGSASAGG